MCLLVLNTHGAPPVIAGGQVLPRRMVRTNWIFTIDQKKRNLL